MADFSVENRVPILLITANVGSLFEDPDRLLCLWVKEFMKVVLKNAEVPKFVGLHLQEVGGKTYEKSMENVHEFITKVCESLELCGFNKAQIFVDEDYNSAEHFTALGNLYFINSSIEQPKIWNFSTHVWEPVESKNVYSGNIELIATKEKAKFPQNFFPECKWSRKGYMRTRWDIDGTVFDLINIHLFHDASNLAAGEEFPSIYCKTRRRALVHTLERFHNDDKNLLVPYFLFGDFNFRCDTKGVIKELSKNLTAHRVQNIKSDSTKVHYRNSFGDNILTVGKKEFNYADHQLKFKEAWLKKYDRELEALNGLLFEYPIEFPPSYPYEEDPGMPNDYMSTRCPAWCDRILMSPHAKEIVIDVPDNRPYGMIGENVCMGDHKPIYLYIFLKQNQGTYRCSKYCLSNANNNLEKNETMTQKTLSKEKLVEELSSRRAESSISCYCQAKSYNGKLNITEDLSLTEKSTQLVNTVSEYCCNKDVMNLPSQESPELHKPISKDTCPISINVIDSNNLYVCMCVQMASAVDTENNVCPMCKNIIERQAIEDNERLISKRILLRDNIIVNCIDSQHLNAPLELQGSFDPYTPESVDSHSSCLDLNNISETVSLSNGCNEEYLSQKSQRNNTNEVKNQSYEIHQRGVISPGQLLSRLENLQHSSLQNFSDEHDKNKCVVELNENEEVLGIRPFCLPDCCCVQ